MYGVIPQGGTGGKFDGQTICAGLIILVIEDYPDLMSYPPHLKAVVALLVLLDRKRRKTGFSHGCRSKLKQLV